MKIRKILISLNKILEWKYLPILICVGFFVLYSTLSLIKHNHFLSGYDASIMDQAIWKYSQFINPIATTHSNYNMPIYFDHVEIIFILLAPLYIVIDNISILFLLQSSLISFSALPIYYMARGKKISNFLSLSLIISYLSFYGIQNAIWSDVHSLVFGISFLSWFVYFLDKKNMRWAITFFVLTIISKEDMALLVAAVSFVDYLKSRNKTSLMFIIVSLFYLVLIFYIYFPIFVPGGYGYANPKGILEDINLYYLINTREKLEVFAYSLATFGGIPLLAPLYLIPFVVDLAHYFILGNTVVTSAQGLFMHYRISLGLLLIIPTIHAINRFKYLNNWKVGAYILLSAMFVQYTLHLPLSYLSKEWFWTQPAAVNDIEKAIKILPTNASVATQVNIAPHLTHRVEIYTLWPSLLDSKSCPNSSCRWFRVGGNPEYMLVDTSKSWDVRHLLLQREEFKETIKNLEDKRVIKKIFESNDTRLYKVIKKI